MKYVECSKIVMQQAFQKAIAVEDKCKKSISERINLEQMSLYIIYDYIYIILK